MNLLQRFLVHRRYRHPWLWVAALIVLVVGLAGAPQLMAESGVHGDASAAVASVESPAVPASVEAHATGVVDQANDLAHDAEHYAEPEPNLSHLGKDLTPKVLVIVMQLALILAVAKVGGWLFESIGIPGVLGELAGGILIGPFVLGHLLMIPVHGHWMPLFPVPTGDAWPISDVLWTVAVVASIVLLFVTGLHTDLKQFLANLGPASVCAVGGVITPFILGAWTVTLFVDGAGFWSPTAMFMGAIMVATSVGITARVLSDIRRLDTPEGVTILGAAVVDDVLGILVLAIVLGIARTGQVDAATVAITAGKAIGVWIGITAIVLALAPWIEKAIGRVKYAGARVGLALALAFLGAGIAEIFGLAFIIGAYSVGLGLSRTKMAHKLMDDLTGVNDFIVPIFFAAMGMLVNFGAMAGALAFGGVITFWAIVSKLIGCGVPALVWFSPRGAARIGMGMLPRGEVALIVAGVGLASGVIKQDIFGVSILMTLVTTVIAPIGLVPLFKGKPGKRGAVDWGKPLEVETSLRVDMPEGVTREFVRFLVAVFQERGFAVSLSGEGSRIWQLVRNGTVASIKQINGQVVVETTPEMADDLHELVRAAEARFLTAVRQIHEVKTDNGPQAGNSAARPA